MLQVFLPHTTTSFQIDFRDVPIPFLFTRFFGNSQACPWIPNGCHTLIYNLSSGYLIDIPASKQYREISFEKNCLYFGVGFSLGILPDKTLRNDTTSSEQIAYLQSCSDFESLITAFLQFLNPKQHLVFPSNAVSFMLKQIVDSHGTLSVEQLSCTLSYSVRHTYRIFEAHMGISPKSFLRILRFQYALLEILSCSDRKNSEFIDYLAYSDQAHFQREFKVFTHLTPKQFIQISHKWNSTFIEQVQAIYKFVP